MIASEWGIPDWRDAASYGDVKRWSSDRWRWEFFRRRQDLRAFFDRWAEASYKADYEVNEGLGPDAVGFLAFGEGKERRRCFTDFGYAGVPNPRVGEQPSGAIIPYKRLIYPFRFIDPAKTRPRSQGVLEVVMEISEEQYEVSLKPNEIAIKFDLEEPLKAQVDAALKVLRRKQELRHGKEVKRVKHQDKWLGYLRTLDAKEGKVSWREIASIHPQTAQTPQTARDKWDQANALRFDF